ncbi:MAG: alpha/beta hydrolase [Gemmataceae bacterium]
MGIRHSVFVLLVGTVVAMAHQPESAANQVQGEIVRLYLDDNEFVVNDFGGKDWGFVLAPDVAIVIDNKPARRDDLKEFMYVTVRYDRALPRPIAREVRGMGRVMFSKVPPSRSPDNDGVFADVQVFYGTDRALNPPTDAGWRGGAKPYAWAGIAGALTLFVMVVARIRTRPALNWPTALGLVATAVLAYRAYDYGHRSTGGGLPPEQLFGNNRGTQLELGTCIVSVPREHQLGHLESPSLLRFEFRFDPEKHVTLRSVESMPNEAFRAALRRAVERSARKEVLAFVHGYNVTFAEAARRTAQLAYDLEFDGPAVFFSWPSQGGLFQYTVDESNVEWATPDLAQFLQILATESGARSVQLVAHSMGNRALGGALRILAADPTHRPKLFREVVFAAPDVDATVFERDLFPAVKAAARRFTLYASSKDSALMASKTVHGSPRAGDSGELLVVLPGLDTIDVSTVDTSLIGHTYYGDSKSIITDLQHLVKRGEPPPKRPWLRPAERRSLPYWLFRAALSL